MDTGVEASAANAGKMELLHPSAIPAVIEVCVSRGVLRVVCNDEIVCNEGDAVKDACAFRNHVLPHARIIHRGNNQLVQGGIHVGEEVNQLSVCLCGHAGILHITGNLDKGSAFLPEVHNVEIVADIGPVLIQEAHCLRLIHGEHVEAEGLCRILKEEDVLTLGRADFVEINLVAFVLAAVGVVLTGFIVGAVVEAVSAPCRLSELGPLNVVLKERAGFYVHHENLLPVTSAAGNGVGHVFAVIGEKGALQGHGAVFAQGIGIQENHRFRLRRIHLIQDSLVLEAVIFVDIPLAVFSTGRDTHFLIIGNLLETFQELLTPRQALKVIVRHLVLGLHPCGGFFRGVILQPAIGIRNLRAEICIHSVVFARHHLFGSAGVKYYCCHQE